MRRLALALALFAALLFLLPLCSDFALADGNAMEAELDSRAVERLQLDLIDAGYLSGGADGILGEATRDAIRAAQAALGFEANGRVTGEFTEALLEAAFPLSLGSRNSLVYRLQRPLYQWGFLDRSPTGYFGKATRAAVARFQRFARDDFAAYMQARTDAEYAAMDLAADVAVDVPLFDAESVACDGRMTRDWYRFLVEDYRFPRVNANRDEDGVGVELVQKRLHALGYLYAGADGKFGGGTERALKYFQRRNGLPQTGSCDDATSSVLFSASAEASDEYVLPYAAYVHRAKSRVYILGWDGQGYNRKVKCFKCSCGARGTPTAAGTFRCEGPVADWYYMRHSKVWVRYAFKIQGNYFFHSVLFRHKGDRSPTSASLHNLGSNVSNGCIRLAVDDIKWIYKHCTRGMKVKIV